MMAAGKVEHSLVCQTIEEMIGPRLTAEVRSYRIDLLYYTGHRKAGTPNPMTAAGKVEHSLVCQTIEEMIGPRLTAEVRSYRIDLLYCY